MVCMNVCMGVCVGCGGCNMVLVSRTRCIPNHIHPHSPQVDVWSVGVIFYQCLYGKKARAIQCAHTVLTAAQHQPGSNWAPCHFVCPLYTHARDGAVSPGNFFHHCTYVHVLVEGTHIWRTQSLYICISSVVLCALSFTAIWTQPLSSVHFGAEHNVEG